LDPFLGVASERGRAASHYLGVSCAEDHVDGDLCILWMVVQQQSYFFVIFDIVLKIVLVVLFVMLVSVIRNRYMHSFMLRLEY
jgi:hypothetical protein